MKIHYNKDFDSYMTTDSHKTDIIELDGVQLIPITELEMIKAEIEEMPEGYIFKNYSPKRICKDINKIIEKHISELKGEHNVK